MSVLELDEAIEKLYRCELISENDAKDVCLRAREVLMQEDNVVKVDAPVTVRMYCLLS